MRQLAPSPYPGFTQTLVRHLEKRWPPSLLTRGQLRGQRLGSLYRKHPLLGFIAAYHAKR